MNLHFITNVQLKNIIGKDLIKRQKDRYFFCKSEK